MNPLEELWEEFKNLPPCKECHSYPIISLKRIINSSDESPIFDFTILHMRSTDCSFTSTIYDGFRGWEGTHKIYSTKDKFYENKISQLSAIIDEIKNHISEEKNE